MASPSWLATQPPTPITRFGLSFFRCCTRPRSEKTFSWAFAHRTGVEQDDVGFFRVLSQFQFLVAAQHIGHLVRVVLVHLAAEGADIELAGSADSGAGGRAALAPSCAASARLRVVSCMMVAVTGVDPGLLWEKPGILPLAPNCFLESPPAAVTIVALQNGHPNNVSRFSRARMTSNPLPTPAAVPAATGRGSAYDSMRSPFRRSAGWRRGRSWPCWRASARCGSICRWPSGCAAM